MHAPYPISPDLGSRQSSLRARPVPAALALMACLLTFSFPGRAAGAMLSGMALVQQLRNGGYVLVMRHAQSPDAPPAPGEVQPDNPTAERQLDSQGMASATALGSAIRKLGIPIGRIYCSPTYRARETVRLAGLARPQIVMQLAEPAGGMRGSADLAQSQWLRQAVSDPPSHGTNTLIVTHTPNIVGAFGSAVANITAGEMLVFKPTSRGSAGPIVARITVAQWQRLVDTGSSRKSLAPTSLRRKRTGTDHAGGGAAGSPQ